MLVQIENRKMHNWKRDPKLQFETSKVVAESGILTRRFKKITRMAHSNLLPEANFDFESYFRPYSFVLFTKVNMEIDSNFSSAEASQNLNTN